MWWSVGCVGGGWGSGLGVGELKKRTSNTANRYSKTDGPSSLPSPFLTATVTAASPSPASGCGGVGGGVRGRARDEVGLGLRGLEGGPEREAEGTRPFLSLIDCLCCE